MSFSALSRMALNEVLNTVTEPSSDTGSTNFLKAAPAIRRELIQKTEFEPLWQKWWKKRIASEQAWKVSKDIEANGFSLDIKEPHTPEAEHSYC